MKALKPFATIIIAILASVTTAYAVTTSEQLELIDGLKSIVDYYPSHENDMSGSLGEYDEETESFPFTRNKEYSLVAVCDDDCTDLDLYVYDKNGKVVGYDDDDTATAIVDFTAEYSGDYDVEVTMYECETSVCFYRVRSYRYSD
ncbi:hypothetical protein [Psychrobacter lutiphocae]|uniref:hypothetical protein n=1 Tax=Psychrobacter lutiphocae TaxID=540500 RepID=UPI00037B1608|nr:hypothetical protein [Psychrobacter lutiphocae]